MAITRYNPWTNGSQTVGFPADLRQPALHQLFEKFFNDDADQSNVVTSQWAPRVDIREESDRFVILADIPGVDPKNIEIHMENGVLTLRGERTSEARNEGENAGIKWTRVERQRGSFHRRFALPDTANPEGITATGRHGTLEIVIPKRPETKPRRINVATE